jgi:Zn-dependent protease
MGMCIVVFSFTAHVTKWYLICMSSDFLPNLAVNVPGFLFAIVAHEWAHAYVALRFGDATAKQQGRLTLNPIAHIDLMGTIIWPLFILVISSGGVAFGYAKPVPVNPLNFKNYRSGLFWVSFAGPLMNILLGTLSAIAFVLIKVHMPQASPWAIPLGKITAVSMNINFILAVFNMIPWPPLDGSKMVSSFLNHHQAMKYEQLSQYSLIFLAVLWFTPFFRILFLPAQLFQQLLLGALFGMVG